MLPSMSTKWALTITLRRHITTTLCPFVGHRRSVFVPFYCSFVAINESKWRKTQLTVICTWNLTISSTGATKGDFENITKRHMMTIQNKKREVKLWLEISKLKMLLLLPTITFSFTRHFLTTLAIVWFFFFFLLCFLYDHCYYFVLYLVLYLGLDGD